MDSQRLKQIEEIFLSAVEMKPAEWKSFLMEKCGGDEELHREVNSLLALEKTQADSFLDSPPEALAAEMFAARESQASLIDKEIGHYKIKKLLGKGGMGEVYLAEDTRLNRKVALKFLSVLVREDENVIRRFNQEAFSASALNHPNILTIYEFDKVGNYCFLATEYIEGKTLREAILLEKFSLIEALNIAEQIASALSAAHKENIIHRDIKPENIMLREDGFVKILDFGLAKLTEKQGSVDKFDSQTKQITLTKTGAIMGTTAYMSPEQVRGKANIDSRTDIWSLGVVLFEMLTGKVPFLGETSGDTIASILKNELPNLSDYHIECPLEMNRIIEKTLAKNAEDRYQQTQNLLTDIKNLKARLEFEAELERSNPANELRKSFVETKLPLSSHKTQPIAQETIEIKTVKPNYSFISVSIIAFLLVIAGFYILKFNNSNEAIKSNTPVNSSFAVNSSEVKPTLELDYSLIVQSYNDGRYKNPFSLSGEMLFRNKDRIRLSIKSPQNGHLYLLNESPKDTSGKTSFNILFPSPTTNNGNSELAAGEEISIPEQSWFQLDEKEGTELIWLIWSKNEIDKLESAKQFANPNDRGKISDPELSDFIEEFLRKHQANKENIKRDDDKKISLITANADILTHVVKLEHH